MTNRIGGARIACDQESLTSAAAIVLVTPRTGPAGLLHPGLAAEGIERRRIAPDLAERMFADVPEFKTGNDFGGMAGKYLAGRRYVERTAPPTADTRLRKTGVIVGHDRVNDDTAMEARAQHLHLAHRLVDLRTRRHQRRAVLHRPAVILNVCDLDPDRAERQRQFHHRLDTPNIRAVHDHVDRQRQTEAHDLAGDGTLAGERAFIAGDEIGGCFVAVLDRNLN